jgi:hypothetical protein
VTIRRAPIPLIASLIACAALAPAGRAAAADGTGDGTFGGDGEHATIAVWASATGDGAVDADDPDGPAPFSIRATPDPGAPSSPVAGLCAAGVDPVTGVPRFGWPYTVETIDNRTGAVVATRRVCVPLDPANPGVPPGPGTITEPPTFGEIWRAANIAAPLIGLNPTIEGVTGLPTRLWASGVDTVQISATIRGYTATGTAVRVAYWFSPGDGTVVERAAGGSATAPAVEHVYERRGDVVPSAGALWDATVVVSGPDLPPTTVDLGRALVVTSRDYRVVEVRSYVVG